MSEDVVAICLKIDVNRESAYINIKETTNLTSFHFLLYTFYLSCAE